MSLAQLQERRERLLATAQAEREQLALELRGLRRAGALADRAVAGARWLQRRPWLLVIAVGLLVALQPGRMLRWSARGFALWRSWRLLRDTLRALSAA